MSVRVAAPVRSLRAAQWVTCRRCDADDAVVVLRSEDRLLRVPVEFHVVGCRRCGFLYTNPQPDDATLAAHYPASYFASPCPDVGFAGNGLRTLLRAGVLAARGYDLGGAGRPLRAAGRPAGRLLAQRFLWLPRFVPGGTLVDVGCASGSYLAELRELGWAVLGVEPDPTAAAAARERLGLDVRTGTLEEAALPDRSADVLVMRMVLEHVRDPRRTLAEARRILRPGGRLLVSVPNAGSREARHFGPDWYAWDLPRHLSHFTTQSLAGLLRETGFASVRMRHLVNANNLANSIAYRSGNSSRPSEDDRFLTFLALLAAAARTAGRIAAEAERPRSPALGRTEVRR